MFGAPAIDELDCGTRNSDALLAHKGAADQTWRLRRNGASIEIVGGDGRCWTPQGAALRDGVAIALETCGHRGGQRFEIFGQRSDVMAFDNADAAEEFGWLRLPNPRPVPARYRSMPGQNLPSGDYTTGIATANDRGAACAQACADDAQCKGFTWVDPRARGGTAMCYKKECAQCAGRQFHLFRDCSPALITVLSAGQSATRWADPGRKDLRRVLPAFLSNRPANCRAFRFEQRLKREAETGIIRAKSNRGLDLEQTMIVRGKYRLGTGVALAVGLTSAVALAAGQPGAVLPNASPAPTSAAPAPSAAPTITPQLPVVEPVISWTIADARSLLG